MHNNRYDDIDHLATLFDATNASHLDVAIFEDFGVQHARHIVYHKLVNDSDLVVESFRSFHAQLAIDKLAQMTHVFPILTELNVDDIIHNVFFDIFSQISRKTSIQNVQVYLGVNRSSRSDRTDTIC
jgi:hypothetical protein